MTLLLNCHTLSKSVGSRTLFRQLSFGVFREDKIGLIGPNGAGKSTLLKILAGLDSPDEGEVSYRKSLRMGYVPQSSHYEDQPIEALVAAQLASSQMQEHEKQMRARILLSKLGFSHYQQSAATLSGGWKKRLDLAKELIREPDVLFLDEPTNHLDLEGILWLEKFLQQESIAFLVTSHDRYFLQNATTMIMELNPLYAQGIFCHRGSYEEFLVKRAEFLDYQQQCERSLASKVRNESDWLRQSPKARTTKAQARVQGAERMIQELSDIRSRNKQATAGIDFEASDRQTRKLLVAKNLSKTLGERLLFSGLDFTLSPGTRLGIVGPNGCGKTTLLKLIARELSPDKGTLKYADDLQIVYFDQHRQKLSPDDTLRRALSPNSDTVIYRGQSLHVNSWGKRFLFQPDRMDLPVRQLSGGERARIGIARLMLQPADVLLLDEPTNDLDIATLEKLEESLTEFPGAIVLITHDRALLDKLATSVIGLGATAQPPLLADYRQWERFVNQHQATSGKSATSEKGEKPEIKTKAAPKLSYREKQELEKMESNILKLEAKIKELENLMHQQSEENQLTELQATCEQHQHAHKELETLFSRWEELDAKGKDEG